jgi:surface antigen
MKTGTASIAPTLLGFLNGYIGRRSGTNPLNMGQCVGLVEEWLLACGKPVVWGNAKDLLSNAPMTAYTVTYNKPTNYPNYGDVVVWDESWGAGYGHCAVVFAADKLVVWVFEQNNPEGTLPVLAAHSYNGVLGWLSW